MKAHRNSHTAIDAGPNPAISTFPELPEEYWVEFLASATKKRQAMVKFRQRIPPRWYKLWRGQGDNEWGRSVGVWHIGVLSCHNVRSARKCGWRVLRLTGVSYLSIHASKEVAGDNNAGAGDEQTPSALQPMQSPLWENVDV